MSEKSKLVMVSIIAAVVLAIVGASVVFIFNASHTEERESKRKAAIAAAELQAAREKSMAEYIESRKAGEPQRAAERSQAEAKAIQEKEDAFKPEISVIKDGVILSNLGKERWDSIRLFVNSDPPFGYGVTIGPMNPLDSKAIGLSEFTKKDGERFNPATHKVMYLWIGGGGRDFHKYVF